MSIRFSYQKSQFGEYFNPSTLELGVLIRTIGTQHPTFNTIFNWCSSVCICGSNMGNWRTKKPTVLCPIPVKMEWFETIPYHTFSATFNFYLLTASIQRAPRSLLSTLQFQNCQFSIINYQLRAKRASSEPLLLALLACKSTIQHSTFKIQNYLY